MLNRVTLIGRLGKDPEVRKLESGATVAKFTLATSESYKDKDGNKQETTEWHNIVVWRQLAEIAEKYLKKGMLVYLEGKVTYREYTDKDNNKKYITEIIGSQLQMLERREGGNTSQGGGSMPETAGNDFMGDSEPPTDDLPF